MTTVYFHDEPPIQAWLCGEGACRAFWYRLRAQPITFDNAHRKAIREIREMADDGILGPDAAEFAINSIVVEPQADAVRLNVTFP